MVFVTVVLSSEEWLSISQIAQVNWPQEPMDRDLSRNEVCRRFVLAGASKLAPKTNGERHELAQEFRHVRPDSETRPHIPGAP